MHRTISIIGLWLFMGFCGVALAGDFTLPDAQGVNHKLSDYRGKWVVVNYWASDCQPCLDEMPELSAFHDRHKDKDAVVLGVNMDGMDAKLLREFAEDHFLSYPVLRANTNHQSPLGPIPGFPTTYLVSPAGDIAASHLGGLSGEMIEQFIREQGPRSVVSVER
ncbi:MAG: TlpA family protein disulfide reductase [Gammaproteobacteria bacterium]|nr:TlpA family protein disulfide reductase [Gammaproteobacteria bacterium]